MEHVESMVQFLVTLILLTWRIWWAVNNASKWQMGFNLAFKGLIRNIVSTYGRDMSEYSSVMAHRMDCSWAEGMFLPPWFPGQPDLNHGKALSVTICVLRFQSADKELAKATPACRLKEKNRSTAELSIRVREAGKRRCDVEVWKVAALQGHKPPHFLWGWLKSLFCVQQGLLLRFYLGEKWHILQKILIDVQNISICRRWTVVVE
jgi:hypothetical protein